LAEICQLIIKLRPTMKISFQQTLASNFNSGNLQALKQFTRNNIRFIVVLSAILLVTTESTNAQSFDPPQIDVYGIDSLPGSRDPVLADLDGDGDIDLFLGANYYKNIGTISAPIFNSTPEPSIGITSINECTFADLDNDGDLDYLVGDDDFGDFFYRENLGTSTSPAFGPIQVNPFGINSANILDNFPYPAFVDIDADGDMDLFYTIKNINYYCENTGTAASPAFGPKQLGPFGLPNCCEITRWTFIDFDFDGDFDLFGSDGATSNHTYFENIGTSIAPTFATVQLAPFDLTPLSFAPVAFDFDNDGDVDLLTRSSSLGLGSHLKYFENNTVCSSVDQTITAAQTMVCIIGDSTTIDVGNSESGLFYYLRNDANDSIIAGPIQGTGAGISMSTGGINATTTYNVIAARHSISLEFDGVNDKVSIPNTPSLQLTSALTLEAWVNFNDFSGFPAIISKNDDPGYVVWVNNTSGEVNARIGGIQISGGNLTLNKWQHVAVTFDGTTKSIYIDGVLTGSLADATPAATGSSALTIGNWSNVNLNLDGRVDEVRIWNVARSPSEVAVDMNNCLSGSETGLMAYYSFEDVRGGSSLTDLTANGNDGSLTNMDTTLVWQKGVPNCSALCVVQMNDLATVTFGDNVVPTAICQDITVQLDASGNAIITANDIDGGSSDQCGIASIVASPTVFDCSNVGVNTVTLTVTDNFGNTASCNALVTVQDTISPTIICTDITVQLDGTGNASITANDIHGGSSDACGIASISASQTAFDCLNVGPNSVILTVTDVNGNAATCIATVTISDTISPVASCQDLTIYLNGSGSAIITAGDIDNGSSDNCSVAMSASTTTFTCADLGPNLVTLTITDGSGNTATCTSTVTVADSTSPVASCQAVTIYLDGSGNGSIVAGDIDNGSLDNCATVSLSASQTAFTCADVGPNTVTLTVTDGSSNVSTCPALITVVDTLNPSLTTPVGASFEYPAGFNIVPVGINTPQDALLDPSLTGTSSALDNCTTVTIDYQDVLSAVTPGACPVIRTVTRTWTAIDASGNSISSDQVFTLTDNTSPAMTCPANFTTTIDLGECGIDGTALISATATDNYDLSLVITNDAPSTIPIGTNTVVWTATDICGNNSQCSQIIIVTDNVNPDTPVLADIIENCFVNVTPPTTMDNCSGLIVGTTTAPLYYSIQGAYVINWTFDDGQGNSINVAQNVTIQNGTVTGIEVVEECGNFHTWMNGVTYIANNTTATHSLVSAAGCDSIVSLNLTFLTPSTSTDVQTACDQFTWIDGNTYASSNNTATHTIGGGAANGCDSIVTLDLTFLTPATGTDIQTACAQFTWIDGNTYASSNNSATHTIGGGAANGCDSIVTLDLTIINGTSGIDTRTECDALVWLDGNTYSSDNNSVTYIIAGGAANGCDSLVTLNLTIINSSTSTDVIDACGSYTWMDGNTYTASDNTATYVIPNTAGCDSTITLNLNIYTVDVSIANASPTLTANETEATFQWIDCDNGNTAIVGETGQSFTATTNGNYAVIVTGVNCSDTSACEVVSNVGIEELLEAELIIYPNPTNTGLFTVKYSGTIEQIALFDLTGRAVQVSTNTSTGMVDASSLNSGKYFVHVQTNKGQRIKSIIITK
jgi:hypothetical protein